jgi:hypothetical protein
MLRQIGYGGKTLFKSMNRTATRENALKDLSVF